MMNTYEVYCPSLPIDTFADSMQGLVEDFHTSYKVESLS